MSDIIQDAKRLLEGTTPGPWVASDNGYIGSTSGVMIHDGQVLGDTTEDTNLIAAAPVLAQALAEDTWEYAVQFKNEESGKWYTNGFYGIGMHGRKWFASKDEAERQIERSYPVDLVEPREYRLARRRVSPVEVINE